MKMSSSSRYRASRSLRRPQRSRVGWLIGSGVVVVILVLTFVVVFRGLHRRARVAAAEQIEGVMALALQRLGADESSVRDRQTVDGIIREEVDISDVYPLVWCNCVVQSAVEDVGGKVVSAVQEGATLTMDVGVGDVTTHRLVLKSSVFAKPRSGAIAMIIEELDEEVLAALSEFDFPLSLSVPPDEKNVMDSTSEARELILQLDIGEGLSLKEAQEEVAEALETTPRAAGIIVAFDPSEERELLSAVMEELGRRGGCFVDGRVRESASTSDMAHQKGVPWIAVSALVDDQDDLMELATLAWMEGEAVALGGAGAIRALKELAAQLQRRKIRFALVSELARLVE